MMPELLRKYKEKAQAVADKSHEEVQQYCQDKDVERFVTIVLQEFDHTDTPESWVSSVLKSFCYQLGYQIGSPNPHSLEELSNLIGNFFYDDSYYSIDETATSYSKAILTTEDGPQYQGPQKLLETAELWAVRELKKWGDFKDRLKPRTIMGPEQFNNLTSQEKWEIFRKGELKGVWICKHCREPLSDGPNSAEPFPGYSIHCSACDGELTRRTGGGQHDPFNWILIEN